MPINRADAKTAGKSLRVTIQCERVSDIQVMHVQAPKLPPALQRVATTPVWGSETPVGFRHVKVNRLGSDRRAHTLGVASFQFSNGRSAEESNVALLRTHTAAAGFAHKAAEHPIVGPFHVRAIAIRRFAVVVLAYTATGAKKLLALAVAHLRRSEGWP